VIAFALGSVEQGDVDRETLANAQLEIITLSSPTPIPLGPLEVCRTDAYSKACLDLGGVSAYAGALAAQGAKRDDQGCFDDQGIGICPDAQSAIATRRHWLQSIRSIQEKKRK
jgi:hypothetical protein